MKKASAILDKDFIIGRIDERIFGSFVEHIGRVVYGGIYEPGHPSADEQGFRKDVLEAVRELKIPIVRYPGGNYVTGFCWEDSVGPVEKRPNRLDLAWFTTETNEIGLHEFADWTQKADTNILYSINLGTRGPEHARDIIEYCNHRGGSKFSDMRISNGKKDPFNIKLWSLGNELDAKWQMGQKTAVEYGRVANEAAKMMKWVDPSIEIIATGSSGFYMPTFGDWEMKMLDECYDNIDYVSIHRFYGDPADDTPNFLGHTLDLEDFIKSVVSMCDAIKGKKHSKKQVNISFDEYNVWYHSLPKDDQIWKENKWGSALPILEDAYSFQDSLLIGLILIALIRNSDRVKIACMAQLVNVIAPIMTRTGGGCWKQTSFYPLMHVSKYGRGTALNMKINSSVYDSKDYEGIPFIDAVSTMDENGNITVFCVNRDMNEPCEFELDLRSFEKMKLKEHILFHSDDIFAGNTENNPNNVIPGKGLGGIVDEGKAKIIIPALSWNVLRFEKEINQSGNIF